MFSLKSYTYSLTIISIFFLIALFTGCQENESVDGTPSFSYFPKESAERQFNFNNGEGFYITLPDCFTFSNNSFLSIYNEENYECSAINAYFTIDHFSSADLTGLQNEAKETYQSKQSKEEFLIDYALEQRTKGLSLFNSSIKKVAKTKAGIELKLAAVKGNVNDYSNPLYYQYASFKLKNGYILIQFIVNLDDLSFFNEDILTVLKSIRKS
jgi:hypothetical protein